MKVQHKTQKREIRKSCRNILIPKIALKQKYGKSPPPENRRKCTGSFSVFVASDRTPMNELSVKRRWQRLTPVSAWGWPR